MEYDTFYDKYFETLFSRCNLVLELSDKEKAKIKQNILAKAKPLPLIIRNNYKNVDYDADSESLLNLLTKKKYNISGYGVIFTHKVNVPAKILTYLLAERKVTKKRMLGHVNDVDKSMYDMLNIMQNILKILANSLSIGTFNSNIICKPL